MVRSLQKHLDRFEKYLYENVYSNFSQLPDYVEKPLIKYLPSLSFILGLLSLLSMYNLWHTAHDSVNSLVNYANAYGSLYGVPRVPVDHHMNLAFWLSMIFLLLEAALFFKAIPMITKQLKSGWDLLYYAFILNVLYALILLLSIYGGIGTLFERLIFSFLSLYLLFEIRDSYKTPGVKVKTKAKAKTKKPQKA